MIVPQFLRFYPGYTRQSLMDEFAITFFALVNSMFRLKPEERVDQINNYAIGMSDTNDREAAVAKLNKSAEGKHGVLQEVKAVKG